MGAGESVWGVGIALQRACEVKGMELMDLWPHVLFRGLEFEGIRMRCRNRVKGRKRSGKRCP